MVVFRQPRCRRRPRPRRNIFRAPTFETKCWIPVPPPPLRCCSDVSRATTSDLTFFWPEAVSYVLVCGCPGSSFCAVRHCNLLARSSSLTLLVITSEVGNISTAAARLCGTRQSLVSDGRPISAPNGASAFNSAQLDGVVNSALLTCILFFFLFITPRRALTLYLYRWFNWPIWSSVVHFVGSRKYCVPNEHYSLFHYSVRRDRVKGGYLDSTWNCHN